MNVLHNNTAVVTGANRGIGLAIARALHAAGIRLGFLGRTRPIVPGEFAECDLSDLPAVPPAVNTLAQRLGTVDFIINNAGTFLESTVQDLKLEDWERIHRVNLTAPVLIIRELLPGMVARRSGRIINIASTAGLQGYQNQSAYCASKHGLLGFSRSLALEVKPHNIHVHSICPGGVDTDLIKGTALGQRLKGQAMINPDDIADTVLFLLQQPENIDLPEITIRRFDSTAN